MKTTFWRSLWLCLAFIGFIVPFELSARTVSWVGGSGDWATASHWNVGEVPNANDDVVINGATNIVVTHSTGDHSVKSIQCQRGLEISGGTLTVSNTIQVNGSFILSEGTLANATILAATNGAPLMIKGYEATLEGVTVNGLLDIGNTFEYPVLTIRNGLVLNGKALVGNVTNDNIGQIIFADQQTLGGSGKIVCAYSTYFNSEGGVAIGPNIKIESETNCTVYFWGSWMNEGTMRFTNAWLGFNGAWTNYGAINVSEGTLGLYLETNWQNNGSITLNNSALQLDGNFSLAEWNAKSGSVNYGFVTYLVGTLNNTNTTLHPEDFGGSWMLSGGTICGGTIVGTADRPFRAEGSSSGVLDGVTINGVAKIDQNGDTPLRVLNGLILNGVVFFGSTTNQYSGGGFIFVGPQTLSGNGQLIFAYDGILVGTRGESEDQWETFTIGENISIQTVQDVPSSLSLEGNWKNLGKMNLTNAWLIFHGDWTNAGTISLSEGSLRAVLDGSNWLNAGSINLTNSDLNLDGIFSVADWNASSGTINKDGVSSYLVGSLNNTNAILRTDDLGGDWILRSGRINGGTVQSIGDTPIVVEESTFNGVTVNGILDVGRSTYGYLTVSNGMTLNGTAYVGNATNYNYGTISFYGDQTLSGNGTMILGSSGLYADNGTLTIGPGVTIQRPGGTEAINVYISGNWINAGTLNFTNVGDYIYLGKGWTNTGKIVVRDGTLFINMTDDDWANTGSINLTNTSITLEGSFTVADWLTNSSKIYQTGGVINVAGSLDNTNSTLTSASFGGAWRLDGGSINGGTVTSTGGVSIVATENGGTLNGVIFNGVLDVGNTFDGAWVHVINGLTLNGTVALGNPTNASLGKMVFSGTETINGNGAIVFGLPLQWFYWLSYDFLYLNDDTVLTLGPGITVRGFSGQFWSDSTNSAFVNKGAILNEFEGQTFFAHLSSFTNLGRIKVVASGALECLGNLTLGSSQSMSVQPGGSLSVGGNLISTVTSSSQISLQGNTVFPQGAHDLEVMSKDMGNVPNGYVNNFGYAKITLTSGAEVKLVNQKINGGGASECVYVNSLVVPSDTTLDLNGFHVYAGLSQVGGTIKNGTISQIPNNGGTISPGGITPGLISAAGAIQEWKFNGKAGQRITIAVDAGSANVLEPRMNYASVELFDPLTNSIAQASNVVAQQLAIIDDLLLPTNGIYTLLVRAPGNDSGANGNYNIAIWDVLHAAAPLTLNQSMHGYIATPYSVNEWTFSAVAGQEVRLDLKNASTFGLQFSLKGPNGWIGFTNLSDDSELIVLPTSGAYTLIARAGNDTYDVDYTFVLEEVSQTEMTFETFSSGELIGNGQAQLFRIVNTNTSPTQISLWLSNSTSRVEIYVRLGAPPTRGIYDYRYEGASASLENVLIPTAAPGEWYILVYGYNVPEPTGFSLQVIQRRLFVDSSAPHFSGSDFGTILTLTGAGFDSNSVVQLTSSAGSNFVAESFPSVSWVKLAASFPPGSVPAGVYDVCASSGGETVCLTNALTVVQGGLPELHTQIIVPNTVGYHNPATIYVEYSNTGTAPMPAPLLTVTAVQNGLSRAYLTLDEEVLYRGYWGNDFHEFTHTVQILASGRVPGLLQPGESYRVPVYYAGWEQPYDFSYPPITFTVGAFQSDNSDVIDWTAYGAAMRPPDMTDAQWTTLLNELRTRLGNTWGSYVTALSKALNGVQPITAPAYDATAIFKVLAEQLIGFGQSKISGIVTDGSTNAKPNVQVIAQEPTGGELGVLRSTFADGEGHFAFTNLPAGAYSFYIPGYITTTNHYTLFENSSIEGITLTVSPVPALPPVTPPEPIHTNESNPVLTLDSLGTPHLVWIRGDEIWHAYHNGEEWVPTGSLPDAHGTAPAVLSSSNLIDGHLPGLLVAWEEIGTNGSALYYSVVVSNNGTWKASVPSLLNETNNLQNRGLSLVMQTNGEVLAVWQKKQDAVTDDTDLYYRGFGLNSGTLEWAVSPTLMSLRPVRFSEDCLEFSLRTPSLDIPAALPVIGGKYEASAAGKFCGSKSCGGASKSFTGGVTFTFGEETVEGKTGGQANWRGDKENCQYLFKSADFKLDISYSRNIRPRKRSIPFLGEVEMGFVFKASSEDTFQWNAGSDFPSRWDTGRVSLSLDGGIYGSGKAEIDLKFLGKLEVEGKVTGTAGVKGTASASGSQPLTLNGEAHVKVEFEGEFQKKYKFNWENEWHYPDADKPGRASLEDSPDFIITVNPLVGTTNVYFGFPVSADVAANIVDDGRPATATRDGDVLLSWNEEADATGLTNSLAARILVSSFESGGWSSPVEIPNSRGFNSDPKLTFDSAGNALAIWAMASAENLTLTNPPEQVISATFSNDLVFAVREDGQWGSPSAIASINGAERAIAIGKTADNKVLLVWLNESSDQKRVYSAIWDGSDWSSPAIISSNAVFGDMSISVVNGRSTVFWTQTDVTTNDEQQLNIYSSELETETGEWTLPVRFTSQTESESALTSISLLSGRQRNSFAPDMPQDCCKDDPKKEHPPQSPTPICTNNCQSSASQSAGSSDPNAKFGPAGYGNSGYIGNLDLYPYTIEFENATNASAPAQQVSIIDPLDSHLDWNSFELGEIAFGNRIITVPPGQQYFVTNMPMVYDGVDFEVQVEAGIDLWNGEVFANFYSIDYFTGLPPNVSIGFLPPEDGTGRGRGHVSYFIKPKANLPTGTVITNVAYIQFDQNPVISTDQVDPHDPSKGIDTNKQTRLTIDVTPPVSAVEGLVSTQTRSSFNVCWSGTDEGAGIVTYDVYVATNGGPWGSWLALTTNHCVMFDGEFEQTFSFYSVAHDGAGNTQTNAAIVATTTVGPPPEIPTILKQPLGALRPVGSNITFRVSAVGAAPLLYQWQFNKVNIAAATNSTFTIANIRSSDAGAYRVIVRNAAGSAASSNAVLTVYKPVIILSQPQGRDLLRGGSAALKVVANGSAPLTYQWYFNNVPIIGQKSPTLLLSGVTPAKAGNYLVVVSNRYSSATSSVANIKIVPPSPVILTPTENTRTNSNVIHVTGTVVTNAGITQVTLSLNGGPAGTVSGIEHWETNLVVKPGTNVLSARALNSDGVSREATRHVFLIRTNVLTLVTNGFGTIKTGFAGPNLLEGVNYSVTAVASANNLFSNWSGTLGIYTNNPFVFKMTSNLVIEANFVTNRFLTAQGIYRGLFAPGESPRNQTNSGAFILNLTSSGAASGKLAIGSETIKLNGKFDVGGSAQMISSRRNKPSVATTLQLDWEGQSVSGIVNDGQNVAALRGYQSLRQAGNFQGQYTMVIFGEAGPKVGPFGNSFGRISVDSAGNLLLMGNLADGTTVSHSSAISKNGFWPLYVSLYGGKGSIWAWNCISNDSIATLNPGSWLSVSNAVKTALYRSGFTNLDMTLAGSRYVATNRPLLNLTNGEVLLQGGNLSGIVSNEIIMTVSNSLTVINAVDNTNTLTMEIDEKTGFLSGRFTDSPGSGEQIKFKGVLLQGQTNAAGYFPGTNRSGSFFLQKK